MRRVPFAVVLCVLVGSLGFTFAQDAPPAGAPTAPMIVAGDVKPPKPKSQPAPEYPEVARANGVQAKVILQAVIDEKGDVESVKVLRSNPLLDDAATDAVKKWKYEPATLNGTPVKVFFTVVVTFKLEGTEPAKPLPPVPAARREHARKVVAATKSGGVLRLLYPKLESLTAAKTEALEDLLADSWARRFSDEELDQLAAFYESPLGKKLARTESVVIREVVGEILKTSLPNQ